MSSLFMLKLFNKYLSIPAYMVTALENVDPAGHKTNTCLSLEKLQTSWGHKRCVYFSEKLCERPLLYFGNKRSFFKDVVFELNSKGWMKMN